MVKKNEEAVQDSDKEIIVVRCSPKVHTGIRRRAGFTFDLKALAVEVTPEQKKMIEEDKYLIVVQAGNSIQQWMERMEREKEQATTREKQQEEKKAAEEAAKNPPVVPEEEGSNEEKTEEKTDAGAEEGQEEGGESGDVPPAEDPKAITDSQLSRMKNEDIVKLLEGKGLVSGTDFDPKAKKQDLIELYKAA